MPVNDELTPDQALEKLLEGNKRFVQGTVQFGSGINLQRRTDVSKAQKPFAVVIACSDSRVPVEYIFDAGIGDVFVIRNAGNLIDDVTLGSIEYAATMLKTPLLLILGHTNCGAVSSAIKAFQNPEEFGNSHIDSIISRLLPAVITEKEQTNDLAKWHELSMKRNLEIVGWQVQKTSNCLSDLIEKGTFVIKRGVYDTVGGTVEIL